MGKTIADELIEEGQITALRRTLVNQLRKRFGDLPDDVATVIQTTEDVAQLDAWLSRVVTSASLDDVGISQPN